MATKKIVSAGTSTPRQAANNQAATAPQSSFVASPEAKSKALTYRLIAAGLWAVAIGLEAFAIFWLLKRTEMNNYMVWLIGCIVVIGVFAVAGSMLWKKSNRLDPASEKDKLRFFVQNQLGAIITLIAFLPLIILILTNDKMSKSQKTVAGIVGVVVMAVAFTLGLDFSPPSVEKMDEQANVAMAYTGQDLVYWVKGGSVYHLCAEYPAGTTIAPLNRGDADKNPVISGTVAQAVASGMNRLSMYGFSECGLTEGQPAYPQYLGGSTSSSAAATPSATQS